MPPPTISRCSRCRWPPRMEYDAVVLIRNQPPAPVECPRRTEGIGRRREAWRSTAAAGCALRPRDRGPLQKADRYERLPAESRHRRAAHRIPSVVPGVRVDCSSETCCPAVLGTCGLHRSSIARRTDARRAERAEMRLRIPSGRIASAGGEPNYCLCGRTTTRWHSSCWYVCVALRRTVCPTRRCTPRPSHQRRSHLYTRRAHRVVLCSRRTRAPHGLLKSTRNSSCAAVPLLSPTINANDSFER